MSMGHESQIESGYGGHSHVSFAGSSSGPVSAKSLVPRESIAYRTLRESISAGRMNGTAGLQALLCGSDRQIGMDANRRGTVLGPEEAPSTLLDPSSTWNGSGRRNGGSGRGCGTDRSHSSVVV